MIKLFLILTFMVISLDGICGQRINDLFVKNLKVTSQGETSSPDVPMVITRNAASVPSFFTATDIMTLVGIDSGVARANTISFGGAGVWGNVRANGTGASPTALMSGNEITNLTAYGHDGTGYITSRKGGVAVIASENWSSTAHGTGIRFLTTENTTTTTTTKANISSDGSLSIGNGNTTAAASAILDLTSTTKGVLTPRMTTAQRDAITSPATGLTLYNTTTNALQNYNGTSWETLNSNNESYPTILPTLNLDFAKTKSLDPRITFTRATTATRVNEFGLIETVASGVPRFDHDPTTLESLGLLIEEARTNILTYSQQFDDVAWTKNEVVVTANAGTAPDGTLTAQKITEDNLSTNGYVAQTPTLANASIYSFSVFAKAAGKTEVNLYHTGNRFAFAQNVVFNLSNGTIASTAGGASGVIKAYPDGWYKCTMVTIATNASGTQSTRIYPGSTTDTGNGTDGVLIWGADYQLGAFPTSYIPTVASSVTRNQDQASISSANITPLWSSIGNTIVQESSYTSQASKIVTTGVSVYVSGNNRIRILDSDGSRTSTVSGRVEGDTSTRNSTPVFYNSTANTVYTNKAAFFVNTGEYPGGVINGGFLSQNTTGNTGLPIGVPNFYFGTLSGSESSAEGALNGYFKNLKLYPKRLTNAELQAVSR
jgi:hypothetical protein